MAELGVFGLNVRPAARDAAFLIRKRVIDFRNANIDNEGLANRRRLGRAIKGAGRQIGLASFRDGGADRHDFRVSGWIKPRGDAIDAFAEDLAIGVRDHRAERAAMFGARVFIRQ